MNVQYKDSFEYNILNDNDYPEKVASMLIYENYLPVQFHFLISIDIRRQIREYLMTDLAFILKGNQFNSNKNNNLIDFFSKTYVPYYLSSTYTYDSKAMKDSYITKDFEMNKEKRLVFLENKRKNEENNKKERIIPRISYKNQINTSKHKKNQSNFQRNHKNKGDFQIKIPIQTRKSKINDRNHDKINKNKKKLSKSYWSHTNILKLFNKEYNNNITIWDSSYTKISIPKDIINKSMINIHRILIKKEDIKYNNNNNEEVLFEIDINHNQVTSEDKYIQSNEENIDNNIDNNSHSKDLIEEQEEVLVLDVDIK